MSCRWTPEEDAVLLTELNTSLACAALWLRLRSIRTRSAVQRRFYALRASAKVTQQHQACEHEDSDAGQRQYQQTPEYLHFTGQDCSQAAPAIPR
jgi:hypothetical protein